MRYFDLQVNGYAGVDFNADDLSAESLHSACALLDSDGVDGILATIITDDLSVMCRRLRKLIALREQDDLVKKVIHGIHIEGPFISDVAGYVGAHPADMACDADADTAKQLLDAAGGLTKIVTLAPECDAGFATTKMLARQGVVVAAGHCNPTRDQLIAAADHGLSMFTHLGNGCPLQMHRHDNVVQRALSLRDRLWFGFIADGVHVPMFALGNYVRSAGIDRCFVVTDAIAAAGLGQGTYRLGGQEVVVDEQLATWSPDKSHLMGSASTMTRMVGNLRSELGMSDEELHRLTYDNPCLAIGCERRDSQR
ncbi:MAG: N-acetylglucosamine-6-phosphate deacetylase [Pirellulales bacterium]|nr:N-acetylglucosamine-6-phosphate deacetylase [Pirellulales bacterium]